MAEEASEMIKAVSKIQRFGLQAIDHTNDRPYDNHAHLLLEYEDLLAAMARLDTALKNGNGHPEPEPQQEEPTMREVTEADEPLPQNTRVYIKELDVFGQVKGFKQMGGHDRIYYILCLEPLLGRLHQSTRAGLYL